MPTVDEMVADLEKVLPKYGSNYRELDEVQRVKRVLSRDDVTIAEQLDGISYLKERYAANLPKIKLIGKKALKVVPKVVPKLAAVMGGPIGMGIAGASTLMDIRDAYALGESTVNPKTEQDRMRQKYLADLMRREDEDHY